MEAVDVNEVNSVSERLYDPVVSSAVVVVGNTLGKVVAVIVACVSGRAPDTESQI